MKRFLVTVQAAIIVFCLAAGYSARAEDGQDEPSSISEQSDDYLFTPEELDDLLAPIALYPDPLIAQMLPAATFVDQIDEAARYVRQYGNNARIDIQPWDISVRAVAHYPEVLFMMDMKYDWTVSLGQAFINQQQDVMDSIQRLRDYAEESGNLVSSPQQQVIDEDGIISIVPAEPELIYVPQYDPLAVYVERSYQSYGFITFGVGFRIGAWLNRDCDWQQHRVYYHGWQGRGWISRARPYIPVRNNVYINKRYSTININRRVERYDTTGFRTNLRRDVQIRSVRPVPATPRGTVRSPGNRGAIQGPAPRTFTNTPTPTPVVPVPGQKTRTPSSVSPGGPAAGRAIRQPQPQNKGDIYRGRQTPGAQPAPSSGYGGYGSSKDATTYQERGRTSRESVREFKIKQPATQSIQPPAPSRGIAGPSVRQSAPAVRQAPAVQPAQQPRRQPAQGNRDEREQRQR